MFTINLVFGQYRTVQQCIVVGDAELGFDIPSDINTNNRANG